MEVSHVTLLLDDYNALMKRLNSAEDIAKNMLKFSVKKYDNKKYIEAELSEKLLRQMSEDIIAKEYPDFEVREYFYISDIEVSKRVEVEEDVDNEEITD